MQTWNVELGISQKVIQIFRNMRKGAEPKTGIIIIVTWYKSMAHLWLKYCAPHPKKNRAEMENA